MGYSDNCCQFCAVSLNIARLRTKNEPASAGWGYSGSLWYSGDAFSSRCSASEEQTGCENVENHGEGDELLHLPGRWCVFGGGYNGWKIAAEEMKGMNLPRYIIKKPSNAPTENDEEDYEKASDYFITSQTTSPQDDFDPGSLAHVRYGVDNFYPQNHLVGVDFGESGWGVPVHDACWKIFERVSRIRLGEVDLEGFMALWFRENCSRCGFQNMKQEDVIRSCRAQWWDHKAGTEYLGANPYEIPGFLLAIQEAYSSYPLGDGVFHIKDVSQKQSYENSTNDFSKLPAELKNMILLHLSSRDIGNLRLASRSFRQLPKRLFLHLIQEELPWFWEFDELRAANEKSWKLLFPGGSEHEGLATPVNTKFLRSRQGNYSKEVNWLDVYKKLCSLKRGILGVRNRARIWNVVEEVVARIARLRAKGWIHVEPTDEEREQGFVKNGFYCPRCQPWQIERRNSRV